MELMKLELRNFKGIKNFTLNAQGGNIDIYGENATGKTTIYDAFLWLLFDKDSQNKKDFSIKTLDGKGEALHGLEHSVEGTFEVKGSSLSLTKVYQEQWTKKRGSATKEFTGHTTDYYINTVPVKKSEYAAKVAEIIDEDIFRLLTNPLYFNEQLHWEKRRAILLEVCGDLTDEDVIASDKKLAQLPAILGDHSLDDYRKIIASRRTKINDELKKIPVRIDEVTQGMPNIEGIDDEGIDAKIGAISKEIKAKNEDLAVIENGGEISAMRIKLSDTLADLQQIRFDHRSKINATVEGKRKELNALQVSCDDHEAEIRRMANRRKANLQDISELTSKMEALRNKWAAVNAQEFTFDQTDDTCPTCGQSLPQDQLAAAREEAQSEFNSKKAKEMEGINESGKTAKIAAEKLRAEADNLLEKIDSINKDYQQAFDQKTALQKEINELVEGAGNVEDTPEYIAKTKEKEAIEADIDALRLGVSTAAEKVEDEIKILTEEMRGLEVTKAQLVEHERRQKRIEELSQKERELAAEYEKLEEHLFLTEEFVKAKVNLLEEKINSKFKLARFKLFEVQVNGGISETCETTYGGVPYSGGLNNAARINVGLDIINTLAEHYGFAAPIFVDNAEAVVQLEPTKGQVIRLIVSEKDKALRAETQGEAIKEAI